MPAWIDADTGTARNSLAEFNCVRYSRAPGGGAWIVEPIAIGAAGAVFVLLVAVTGYLFKDNQKLRGIIRRLEQERDDLIKRVEAAETTSKALLDVMKGVMRGEIRTARTEERAQLFEEAYRQLVAIERGDINIVNVTGGEVGQAASGRENTQEQ